MDQCPAKNALTAKGARYAQGLPRRRQACAWSLTQSPCWPASGLRQPPQAHGRVVDLAGHSLGIHLPRSGLMRGYRRALLSAFSNAQSSRIRHTGVARMDRSMGRERHAVICSHKVAFARRKCLATDAAEQSLWFTARHATRARPLAASASEESRKSSGREGLIFAVTQTSSSSSAPSTQ